MLEANYPVTLAYPKEGKHKLNPAKTYKHAGYFKFIILYLQFHH
jgi:hypothetical protein